MKIQQINIKTGLNYLSCIWIFKPMLTLKNKTCPFDFDVPSDVENVIVVKAKFEAYFEPKKLLKGS